MMAVAARVRAKVGGYDDDSWRRVAAMNLALIIATEQGRAWWEARGHSAEITEFAESSPYYSMTTLFRRLWH